MKLSVAVFVGIGYQGLIPNLNGAGIAEFIEGEMIGKAVMPDLGQAVIGIVAVAYGSISTGNGQR